MFDFMIPGILHALGLGPKWSICSVITLELLLKWLGFDGCGGEAVGAESLRRGMCRGLENRLFIFNIRVVARHSYFKAVTLITPQPSEQRRRFMSKVPI